jgi:hypothetical protein
MHGSQAGWTHSHNGCIHTLDTFTHWTHSRNGRVHTMDAAGKSLTTCSNSTLEHVQAGSLRVFLDGEELRWSTQATLDRSFYTCVALRRSRLAASHSLCTHASYRVAIRLCTPHLAPTARQNGLHIEAAIGLDSVDGDCLSTVCNVGITCNGLFGPYNLTMRSVVNYVLCLGCSDTLATLGFRLASTHSRSRRARRRLTVGAYFLPSPPSLPLLFF